MTRCSSASFASTRTAYWRFPSWMTGYTEVGDLVPVHLGEDWSSLTRVG